MEYQLLPGRVIPNKHRSLSGFVSLSDGRSVAFESSIERDAIIRFDFEHPGRYIETQPFTLQYVWQGRKRLYTPDILVRRASDEKGTVDIVEVKSKDATEEELKKLLPSFEAMRAVCEERNWGFQIITDDDNRADAMVQNANFLGRYKNTGIDEAVKNTLTTVLGKRTLTPNELLGSCFAGKEQRAVGMAVLWGLIANRVVVFDFRKPLRMDSTYLRMVSTVSIHAPECGEFGSGYPSPKEILSP